MTHLSQLQTDFQAYLLDDAQGINFINAIVNDQKVGATKRLSIYVDAYRLRIIEALATAYPKCTAYWAMIISTARRGVILSNIRQLIAICAGWVAKWPRIYKPRYRNILLPAKWRNLNAR